MARRHNDNPTLLTSTEQKLLAMLVSLGEAHGLLLFRHAKGAFKKGTVYVLLGRLRERGFVTSRNVSLPEGEIGPSRVVYRVTEVGTLALKSWAAAEAVWLE